MSGKGIVWNIPRGAAAVLACAALWLAAAAAAPPAAAAQGAPAVIVDAETGETPEQAAGESVPAWAAGDAAVPADAESFDPGGKSAVLIELSGGKVLMEKNAHERLSVASVTKIMTLLLIMEAVDSGLIGMDDTVTCSEHAASMGGSQIWLEPGEAMTVSELVKAIAVVSANDACAMMAEYISGSEESFVQKMNGRAAALGMTNTLFVDCSGLSDEGYSSAYDVALMSRELMKHEAITKYTTIWMDTLRGGESQLVNTNKLIRFYPGATGLKTGTTGKAGHCLSATAARDGMGLCAVILGCETTAERFGGARKMLDYGFAGYAVFTPQADADALKPVRVLRGTAAEVRPEMDEIQPLLIKKGQEGLVRQSLQLAEDLEAPVYAGQVVGSLTLTVEGETAAVYDVRAAENVPRLGLWTAFVRLFLALAA